MNVQQGELGLTDTILHSNNVYGGLSFTSMLRFRNSSAYTLTVSRYSKKTNRTDIVYQYALSAGDTVLDSSQYILNYGDILYARSSVAGTTYMVNSQ